jgi:hypothetical protein
VSEQKTVDFASLYARFKSPIAAFDCGHKCAPYNERGVPFCCDPKHMIPTAYQAEWEYLRAHTDLWHIWEGEDPAQTAETWAQVPDGQVLIGCLGHERCQRDFRALTCRSFPFLPYLDSEGDFTGLTVHWEYRDRCWVISNLNVVTPQFRKEFIQAYDLLFEHRPSERENYANHSAYLREQYSSRRRTIPLLHRDGKFYKVSPGNEGMCEVSVEELPKYGPYKVAAELLFPDEEDDGEWTMDD